MNVTQTTPDRLTLEDKPWLLGIILGLAVLFFAAMALLMVAENLWLALGFAFGALMFGAAFAVFVRRVIAVFDRGAGAVVIRTATVLGQSERTIALSDIQAAEVDTTRSTSRTSSGRMSHSLVHRPVLRTVTGPVPLTEVYSGGDGATRVVDALNRWLAG